MAEQKQAFFDVVAVNIATGAERLLAAALTERNAEAVVMMAVARRGVDTEFYKTVPSPTPSHLTPQERE